MGHFKYEDKKLMDVDFDSHDFACLHDSIINASNKHLNQDELIEVWNLLPIDIKTIALQWGMNDTVFGDEVYGWAEKNIDKLEKYKTWEYYEK